MGLTGKYNFQNIKRMGAAGIRAALRLSPYTAWAANIPVVSTFFDLIWEGLSNWLANQGLIVLNIGAIYVNGELDQHSIDKGLDDAMKSIQNLGGRDKLTPEQKREIDEKFMAEARKFIVIGNKSKS